jgi:hypothetical protein
MFYQDKGIVTYEGDNVLEFDQMFFDRSMGKIKVTTSRHHGAVLRRSSEEE